MSSDKAIDPLQDIYKNYPSFHLIRQTPQVIALCTIIRNKDTSRGDFVFYADRLFRLLIEDALSSFPFEETKVVTPANVEFQGTKFAAKICGVSIMRAGDSMEKALREVMPNVRIGKILIQRDLAGNKRDLLFSKYPQDIATRRVILMDPIIATGGSAIKAAEDLISKNVKEEHIIFINLVAAPEGVREFGKLFPRVRIISCALDNHLNESALIVPGLGDFGDRYFGTDIYDDKIFLMSMKK